MRLSSPIYLMLLLVACGGGDEEQSSSSSSSSWGDASSSAASSDPAPEATASEPIEGDTLVRVGDLVITVDDFKVAAARKMPSSGDALSLDEKKEVLDQLVSDRLLYLKGLALGVDQDPKVQKVVVNTLLRDIVYADVRNTDFPEADLRSYYNTHREDFIIQAKVQIRRILISEKEDGAGQAEAQRLHGQVSAEPGRFREIAAKFSEGDFKRRGGDMGFIPRSGKPGIDQALVDKAFTMEPEQISEVFKTEEGWNIVMVAKKRDRHERTFQQVRGAVLRKLKNDRMTTLLESYVADLKNQTSVAVDEAKLESLEIEAVRRPGGRDSLGPMLAPPGGRGGLPQLTPPGLGQK